MADLPRHPHCGPRQEKAELTPQLSSVPLERTEQLVAGVVFWWHLGCRGLTDREWQVMSLPVWHPRGQ